MTTLNSNFPRQVSSPNEVKQFDRLSSHVGVAETDGVVDVRLNHDFQPNLEV
jgi:hypothetical protein